MVETLCIFDERGVAVGFHIGENLRDAFVDLRIEGGSIEQRFELFLEIVGILEYDAHFFKNGRRFRRPVGCYGLFEFFNVDVAEFEMATVMLQFDLAAGVDRNAAVGCRGRGRKVAGGRPSMTDLRR